MGIAGNLKTMALAELLQWLSQGQKTGTLVFQGDEIVKRVFFENGMISSSASTDQSEYLGSLLVAYGYATNEEIDLAIARQQEEKKLIGKILVEMGTISEDQLQQMLQLKAEEAIYDIFTWEEGAFEFQDGDLPTHTMIHMELDVQWVVLEGTRRLDEWIRMKESIPSPHCVPVSVTDLTQLEVEDSSARILTWVDDQRSVAEISEGAHTSKFLVMQTLVEQVLAGTVKAVQPKMIEVRVEVPVPAQLAYPAGSATSHPAHTQTFQPPAGQYVPLEGDWPTAEAIVPDQDDHGSGGTRQFGAPAPSRSTSVGNRTLRFAASQNPTDSGHRSGQQNGATTPRTDFPPASAAEEPASDGAGLLHQARDSREHGEFDVALDRLRAAGKLGEAKDRIEAEMRILEESLERAGVKLTSVPRLECAMDELMSLKISPQEGFMLTRVDGSYDIKSILRISGGVARVDAQVLFWKLRRTGHVSV